MKNYTLKYFNILLLKLFIFGFLFLNAQSVATVEAACLNPDAECEYAGDPYYCTNGVPINQSQTPTAWTWSCFIACAPSTAGCIMNKPVNCVGSWSDSGTCSVTGACGQTGTVQQTYTITTPASGGGSSCPYASGATQWGSTVCSTAACSVGTINVSSNIPSSWTITGPATLSGSDVSQTYLSQPTGTYNITWGAVSGYTSPATQALTLTPAGTINFIGTYNVSVPSSPASVSASPSSCGTGQIDTSWPAVSGVTGYDTQIDEEAWTNRGNVTSHSFTGLAAGSSHTINVRAWNGAGPGTGRASTPSPVSAPAACSANITATPGAIVTGGSTVIEWFSSGYTSCVVDGYPWPAGTTGNETHSPITNTLYVLVCDGNPVNSVEVKVNTDPNLTVSPRIVPSGSSATLTWDTNNGNEALCALTGGALGTSNPLDPGNTDLPIDDAEQGTYTIPAVTARTTYTLTCGTLSDTATVEIVPVGFES